MSAEQIPSLSRISVHTEAAILPDLLGQQTSTSLLVPPSLLKNTLAHHHAHKNAKILAAFTLPFFLLVVFTLVGDKITDSIVSSGCWRFGVYSCVFVHAYLCV